jgi:hypothetical protein
MAGVACGAATAVMMMDVNDDATELAFTLAAALLRWSLATFLRCQSWKKKGQRRAEARAVVRKEL